MSQRALWLCVPSVGGFSPAELLTMTYETEGSLCPTKTNTRLYYKMCLCVGPVAFRFFCHCKSGSTITAASGVTEIWGLTNCRPFTTSVLLASFVWKRFFFFPKIFSHYRISVECQLHTYPRVQIFFLAATQTKTVTIATQTPVSKRQGTVRQNKQLPFPLTPRPHTHTNKHTNRCNGEQTLT